MRQKRVIILILGAGMTGLATGYDRDYWFTKR